MLVCFTSRIEVGLPLKQHIHPIVPWPLIRSQRFYLPLRMKLPRLSSISLPSARYKLSTSPLSRASFS